MLSIIIKGDKMELKDCFEILPVRYHDEFKEHIVDEYSIKKIDKVFTYFVEEIIDELSDKEKNKIFA